MPDTRGVAGFGAGFQQTHNARTNRMQVELMQRQNQQQQQELMRRRVVDSVENAIKQTAQLVKDMTPVLATAEGNRKEAALQTLKQGRGAIFDSTSKMLNDAINKGLITTDEAEVMSQRAALSGNYTDPRATQQLAAEGEGATEQAKAEAKLPSELEKIQEQGRQARMTKAVPSTQRVIQDAPDEMAPPQISSIYGLENATVGDLKKLNIYLPEDTKTIRELIPANSAYSGLIKSGTSAIDILQQNPDVAPIGGLAEFSENVRSQAVALAGLAGINIGNVDLESEVIQSEVEKLAGANRELQSTMISMAYASAIAKGQTGQGLSDKDVANEVKQIGGDARTGEGMQRAVMAFMDRTETEYRTRIANTLNRMPPKSAYSMTPDELVQMIEEVGGFENLPEQDQLVVRARAKFLSQREQ